MINKGPFCGPLMAKYGIRAVTGHTSLSVLPKISVIPARKGSVFDCFSLSVNRVGQVWLSTATSSYDRLASGS